MWLTKCAAPTSPITRASVARAAVGRHCRWSHHCKSRQAAPPYRSCGRSNARAERQLARFSVRSCSERESPARRPGSPALRRRCVDQPAKLAPTAMTSVMVVPACPVAPAGDTRAAEPGAGDNAANRAGRSCNDGADTGADRGACELRSSEADAAVDAKRAAQMMPTMRILRMNASSIPAAITLR